MNMNKNIYTNEEVNHILYHNRSVGLVKNFLPLFDVEYLLKKEDMLSYCRGLYMDMDESNVEFNVDDFVFDSKDIIFEKKDLNNLSDMFINETSLSEIEHNYLIERGVTDTSIKKYNLSGLSLVTDTIILRIIGASTHPLLGNILGDGITGGGIIFPLYEGGDLVNISIRKLDDSNKMKYTLAIPDISLWGISEIEENSEIWLCEGLFDRISMLENGFENVISASTPGLSIIHLLKILEKKPSMINIWSDKDQTGLKHSAIIQKFFRLNNIYCEVYISEESKDPDDHFKDGLGIDDIYPIDITKDVIYSFPKNINMNFLEYLKERKY